ncbi:MAG: mobile mystery protein B [Saprospiraceae bacterium]
MGLDLDHAAGQTPLDEDEKDGLLIKTITTRGELDEFEQQNIEKAVEWTMNRKFKQEVIHTETFIKEVHKRMYAGVWSWAGKFRKTNKYLGVDKLQIGIDLKNLMDDTKYWIEHKNFEPDEIALRFKHRIVSIHCFANGNGRHSRLMADIIIEHIFKKPVFTWGSSLVKQDDVRAIYLKAIRAADGGHYDPLLQFARS